MDFKTPIFSGSERSESCGEGWEKNGEHCYFWSTEKKNWNDAEDFCQMEGGHLASVESEATRQYLEERTNRIGLGDVWLGGNDLNQEGVWQWTDGTPWDQEVEFWRPGEPNNSGGAENCLELHLYGDMHNGRWNDDICSKDNAFLCSKRTEKQLLNSNATVISGPADCSNSDTETKCQERGLAGSGELCISGGGNQWEGNVFFEGRPLCDDMWGLDEAELVCKDLGYGHAKNFTANSIFGSVKGPLSEVFCQKGSEHFSSCTVTSQQLCLGEEVAGVICETEDEKMRREEEEEMLNQCLVTGMEYHSKPFAVSDVLPGRA